MRGTKDFLQKVNGLLPVTINNRSFLLSALLFHSDLSANSECQNSVVVEQHVQVVEQHVQVVEQHVQEDIADRYDKSILMAHPIVRMYSRMQWNCYYGHWVF